MKNPWLKKNPFLSMWLSGANSVTGAARGQAIAEGRRQASSAMTEATKQMASFWTLPITTEVTKKKRRKAR